MNATQRISVCVNTAVARLRVQYSALELCSVMCHESRRRLPVRGRITAAAVVGTGAHSSGGAAVVQSCAGAVGKAFGASEARNGPVAALSELHTRQCNAPDVLVVSASAAHCEQRLLPQAAAHSPPALSPLPTRHGLHRKATHSRHSALPARLSQACEAVRAAVSEEGVMSANKTRELLAQNALLQGAPRIAAGLPAA